MFRIFGSLMILAVLAGCSKKDITQYMTSREHFDYAMKFFNKKDYTKAQEQFTLITYKHAGSDVADDAQFYVGECWFRMKDYVSAAPEFERLATSFPKSDFMEKAMYQLVICYHELSPGYALDQKYTYDAQAAVQNFVELFPRSVHKEEVEKIAAEIKYKLSKKHFESAQIYRKISEYEAAIVYYDHVITDYYDSPFVSKAKFWKGYCNYKLDEFQKARLILQKVIDENPLDKELVNESLEILDSIKEKEAKAAAKAAKEAAKAKEAANEAPAAQ